MFLYAICPISVLRLDLKNKKIEISPEQAIEDLETMYNILFFRKKEEGEIYKNGGFKQTSRKNTKSYRFLLKKHIIA